MRGRGEERDVLTETTPMTPFGEVDSGEVEVAGGGQYKRRHSVASEEGTDFIDGYIIFPKRRGRSHWLPRWATHDQEGAYVGG